VSSSKITIKEVAKRAGVSIATVSRFLSKSSLKKINKQKVEKAITELNYHPFIYARRLAGGQMGVFGLVIPGYEGVFYSFYATEIIREVALALSEKDIDLHLNVFRNQDNFKTSIVDGIIMADILGNQQQFNRFLKEEVPLVVINRKFAEDNVNFVAIDNFKGAYDAVEFLINHGHQRIIHFAGDLRVQCAGERLKGFQAALKKHKIKISAQQVKYTNFSRRQARIALEELFSSSNLPTAIFCCSDEVASEVLSFAEEKRINVPKKLSIIGFDDNPYCLNDHLMLTTVRQPLKRMVQQAVKILSDSVNGKKQFQKIILDPEFIIRDTVSFC